MLIGGGLKFYEGSKIECSYRKVKSSLAPLCTAVRVCDTCKFLSSVADNFIGFHYLHIVHGVEMLV